MATVKFIVRAEKRFIAPIYIRYNHGSVNLKVKSGLQVEPSRWSNETETIRQRKLTETDETLIAQLKALRDYIISEEKLYSGERSKEWLQGVINKFHGQKDSKCETLNGYMAEFIEKAEKSELKNKAGLNFAKGTLTNFKGFQRALLEYQGIYSEKRLEELEKKEKKPRKRKIIDFEDVTIDFYNDFVAYLANESYQPNTMDKFIGTLKYFMRKALREKKHSNREFLESAFAGFYEESHAVYLTTDEIEKIYNADLSKYPAGHTLARDAFIVLCETALRVSDYPKVDLSVKGQLIYLYQTKTSGRVVLPVSSRLQAILDNYAGKLPAISDQKINKYIKDICQDCKIDEPVTWIEYNKGLRVEKTEPKYKLITCHTARRSAATNMVKAGIQIPYIMKITGHKSEKTFRNYVRISEEEVAIELQKHEFFSNLRVAK